MGFSFPSNAGRFRPRNDFPAARRERPPMRPPANDNQQAPQSGWEQALDLAGLLPGPAGAAARAAQLLLPALEEYLEDMARRFPQQYRNIGANRYVSIPGYSLQCANVPETPLCTNNADPRGPWAYFVASDFNVCLTGQCPTTGSFAFEGPAPLEASLKGAAGTWTATNAGAFLYLGTQYQSRTIPTSRVMRLHEKWARDPGTVNPPVHALPKPATVPTPNSPPDINDPWTPPRWLPAVDPLSIPITAPPFVPAPLPWPIVPARRTNPNRSPREQTQRGNEAPGKLPELPGPNAGVVVRSVTQPLQGLRLDVAIDTRLAVNPTPKGPRVKEAKLILAASKRSLAAMLMNAATESNDFLTAIHKALPDHCKSKRTNPVGKARDIYACFSEINWPKALCNVAKNEFEDNLYGRGGRGWARVNRKLNHPSGSPRRAAQPRMKDDPTDVFDEVCDAVLGGH